LAKKGQVTTCYCCGGEVKKSGRFQNRNRVVQRYACKRCGKTFSDVQPLHRLRVEFKQACQVVHLLVEGMGIRAISRFTGLHRDTVLAVLESAGEKCARVLDENVRNVKAEYVAADEMVSFVRTKQYNTDPGDMEHGQFYTYLAVDMFSKLIITSRTDKRTMEATRRFCEDLRERVPNRFQLATDGLPLYKGTWGAVAHAFGKEIDYGTEEKVFRSPRRITPFAPLVLTGIRKRQFIGSPHMPLLTTCHCERTNLSVRLFNRRFTRLTLGYSKKLENLRHAMAMFVAHFNFCRVHSAHGQTPAQRAGLTDHAWTIEKLLAVANG
jgi:transposase-like protein/IS1 family transposase